MTNESIDIKIENVPLPERRKKEKIPEELIDAIKRLAPGESFFIACEDEDHTHRRMAALRQRCTRIMKDQKDTELTVRKRTERNEIGFRVFRMTNEDNEPTQITGSGFQGADF